MQVSKTLQLNLIILILTLASLAAFIPQPNPDDNKSTLTVATYNVHQYFEEEGLGRFSIQQVYEALVTIDADIIGLQESEGGRITSANTNGIQWLASKLDMYAYYGPETQAQIYGVSLLSKYPILNSSWQLLPAEESIERAAIEVIVDTPIGELAVIVTHFQTGSYVIDRTNQAQTIVDMAKQHPRAVILGDFNTRPNMTDPAYAILNSTFTDTWSNCGNDDPGYTASAADPQGRIDYIFLYGSDWTVSQQSCSTFGTPRASDHLGVVTEISF